MKYFLLLLGLGLGFGLSLAAQTYILSPEASRMEWTGMAAFSAYSLSGTIQLQSGRLQLSGDSLLEAELIIDMRSIDSEIGQLTRHLRSADFFEVNRWPEASFRLNETSVLRGDSEIQGFLALKDQGKDQTVWLSQVIRDGMRLRITGSATVDRTAFGIYYHSPNYFEGLKQEAIADEFVLEFELVLVHVE